MTDKPIIPSGKTIDIGFGFTNHFTVGEGSSSGMPTDELLGIYNPSSSDKRLDRIEEHLKDLTDMVKRIHDKIDTNERLKALGMK